MATTEEDGVGRNRATYATAMRSPAASQERRERARERVVWSVSLTRLQVRPKPLGLVWLVGPGEIYYFHNSWRNSLNYLKPFLAQLIKIDETIINFLKTIFFYKKY
jgi:hypothetical protein